MVSVRVIFEGIINFYFSLVFYKLFGRRFNKTSIPRSRTWIRNDYSQLDAMRLFSYLPSHTQRALVD